MLKEKSRIAILTIRLYHHRKLTITYEKFMLYLIGLGTKKVNNITNKTIM